MKKIFKKSLYVTATTLFIFSGVFHASAQLFIDQPLSEYNNVEQLSGSNIDYVETICSGCNVPATVTTGDTGTAVSATFVPATVETGTAVSSTFIPATYESTGSQYSFPTVLTTGAVGYTYPTVYSGYSGVGYTYPSGSSYAPSIVGSYGYVTGSYTNNTSCPSGSTLVNGVCQTVTTTCPAGSSLINGVCTVTTVNTNYTCWNGTVVAYSSLCPINYNTSSYYNGSYYNPVYYNTYQPVVSPGYSTVVQPPVVKFNNVVTSVVTEITTSSGRCNGIGLIANGAPSLGWFEYGETANLGRTTASAQIGRSSSAPFSNVLANLKPSTKYYCRAVMQNQYGTVKGEIVSFVTKSTATVYVKPVAKKVTTVTKKVSAPVKKPEITCTDGTTVWVKNESQAKMFAQGEKLIGLRIEKSETPLSANASVSYRISYKNLTNTRLVGVVGKITLPVEVKLMQTTAGFYDESTHTLTFNLDTIDPNGEGVVAVTGKVAENAPVGKTIVATAYIIYTVPDTQVQDEVTAYVVGSITPPNEDVVSKMDTGAKKVIGTGERGFMPNNLVEWLALIAILFIIFILARSIYVSFKEDEDGGHGH
jgi:hypothetical protein